MASEPDDSTGEASADRLSRSEKAAHIRRLMSAEGPAVATNTKGFNRGRYDSVADLEDYEGLKDRARAIKEDAIDRLPELIDRVSETVRENGGTVYLASDAADANRYVQAVCEERDADLVAKSKSMTSEEIEVNEALESAGVEVVETDLGEWVLQVAEEAPSHIVAPAIHRSRADIADLFNEQFDPEDPLESAEELTAFAREKLWERVRQADVGMTGANFVVAESGTIALITSEGNARKSVLAGDTHVAVAGVEKLLPTVEDLQPFVELIARSGTGQDITSYVSLLTPPADTPTVDFADAEGARDRPLSERGIEGGESEPTDAIDDGDAGAGGREFHLVLIDNGRLAMREDPHLAETLYCVRCSACANTCANFQHVGGHGFGGETYSGGIATGWEYGVHGAEAAASFNDLCTGCSRCVEACPVGIDIPWINTVVRDRLNRGADADEFDFLVDGLAPDAESAGIDRGKRLFGNFGRLAKLASATAPLSNWLADTDTARQAMAWLFGVDPRRDLPAFERETLRDWFSARGGAAVPPDAAAREAVLYPDTYTNYVRTDRGKAAVRVLEALDVHVRLPAVPESGRAPLSQGMIATAEDHASRVYGALDADLDAGRDVVAVEPSDLAMFRADYEHLLPEDAFRRLADGSYEVFEYVYGRLENGADPRALRAAGDGTEPAVAYHGHCQQRTLGLDGYTTAVLDELGYDVVTSTVECCGMAGSFGYKSEYYELSMDVGEDLREELSGPTTANRTVLASGTSCLEQLEDLLDRPARHPVELVDPGS